MKSKQRVLEVFSTCPRSDRPVAGLDYVREVEDVARSSEGNDWKDILVYSDNSMPDPWLVSERILQNMEALCPLIAFQSIYMFLYAAAKMVATFWHLHARQVYLDMIAGGFKSDLIALNDTTPHDKLPPEKINCGIRVGIIARPDEEEAWKVAEQHCPGDRKAN